MKTEYYVREVWVSIPSRGFWFFEGKRFHTSGHQRLSVGFNPLAGILVF